MELDPEQDDHSQRTMIALIVIMGMVMVWSAFFGRPSAPTPPPDEAKEQPAGKPATAHGAATRTAAEPAKTPELKPAPPAPKPATSAPATPAPRPPVQPPPAEPPPVEITRRSALFSALFTNQDGALARLTLLDYFRTPLTKRAALAARKADPGADLTEFGLPLLGQPGSEDSFVILSRAAPLKKKAEEGALDSPVFATRRYELVPSPEPNKVVFRARFAEGRLEVTKTFLLPSPGDELQRHILLEVQLQNLDAQPLALPGYRLRGPGGIAADQGPESWDKPEPTEGERKRAVSNMGGAVATENDRGEVNVARVSCSALQKEEFARSEGRVLWSAAQSNYFAAILRPTLEKEQKSFVWSGGEQSVGEHNLSANIETAAFTLQPGQSVVHRYRLFAGPKTRGILAPYQAGYEHIIERRWLDPLSDLMGWVLRGAYAAIPNYGIAIIILTILVRIALFPLSRKSQTSMHRMQKLQPQMLEIREKFKNDKKRQQEETMKLYREYGVNPVGGCLPIALQIPVFIGLWRALSESIELRQAPFALWIKDLSQPDHFMGAVNILPLISCAIMFVQQRTMPKSPDPQQQQTQKIMGYMMPVFLAFILYSLPSGLALYFIASTVLGIAEQKVIKRHLDKLGALQPVNKKPSKQQKKAGLGTTKKKPF